MTSSMRAAPSLRIINRSKPSATPGTARQTVAHRREQTRIVRGFVATCVAALLEIGRHAPLHDIGVDEFVVTIRHFHAVDDQFEASRNTTPVGVLHQPRQRSLVCGVVCNEDAARTQRVDRVSDQQIEQGATIGGSARR